MGTALTRWAAQLKKASKPIATWPCLSQRCRFRPWHSVASIRAANLWLWLHNSSLWAQAFTMSRVASISPKRAVTNPLICHDRPSARLSSVNPSAQTTTRQIKRLWWLSRPSLPLVSGDLRRASPMATQAWDPALMTPTRASLRKARTLQLWGLIVV